MQQGVSEINELQRATLVRCDKNATRIGAWRVCARPVPPLTEASMWQLLRGTVLRPKKPNRRSAALSISPNVTWLPDERDDLDADRLGADPRRWSWDGDEGWNRRRAKHSGADVLAHHRQPCNAQRKIGPHMPLTQLPTAMMNPRTIKVTRPINSAYSIRLAPCRLRQMRFANLSNPTLTFCLHAVARGCSR